MAVFQRALISIALGALALLAYGGSASAYGAVIHVASHGDDGADGSQSAPLRSLQRAVAVARPGDRVVVGAGSYSGFRMTTSGSPDAPISIAAADGAGRPTIIPSGALNSVVLLDGVHHVSLSGLEIAGNATRWGAGVRIRGGSSHVELSDLHIHDNRSFGVLLEDVTEVVLAASRISKNETGLQVSRAGAGVRIAGNDVHDNDRMIVDDEQPNNDRGANGMVFYRTTGPVTVERNRMWANRATSHDYGFDGGAFEIYAASRLAIRDNVVWNNENVMETGTDGSLPCSRNTFTGNVAYGGNRNGPAMGMILRCASDMIVANNTFEDLDRFVFDVTAAASSFGGSVDGLSITRNIAVSGADKLLSIDSALPPSVVIDQNLAFNRAGGYIAYVAAHGNTRSLSTFVTWTGMQAAGIQADPLFVDAARADYRLREASPAATWGAGNALDLAREQPAGCPDVTAPCASPAPSPGAPASSPPPAPASSPPPAPASSPPPAPASSPPPAPPSSPSPAPASSPSPLASAPAQERPSCAAAPAATKSKQRRSAMPRRAHRASTTGKPRRAGAKSKTSARRVNGRTCRRRPAIGERSNSRGCTPQRSGSVRRTATSRGYAGCGGGRRAARATRSRSSVRG